MINKIVLRFYETPVPLSAGLGQIALEETK